MEVSTHTAADQRVDSSVRSMKLKFDEFNQPNISLPPPSSGGRSHVRSKTATELPPLFTRSQSASPTRSSTLLPFRRSSRSVSPIRPGSRSVQSAVANTDISDKTRPGAVERLSSWFEGSSEPVSISFVPAANKEQQESFYKMDAARQTLTSQDNLTQRVTKRHTPSPSTANSSVFSFFRRSVAQPQAKPDPDHILQLDISASLYPDGPVQDISATSFAALQENAEAVIKKIQLSYADNLSALRHITSEKAVQADELEAAQTRNEHLKLQLVEMAERSAEQESCIAELRDQLNKHQQSIRMIAEDEPNGLPGLYRRNRHSGGSSYADSMADSEMSSAASVFSEAESSRTTATSVTASPVMKHARLHNPTITPSATVRSHVTPVLVADCSNCHGVPAAEAWDVIGVMKAESMGLKQRVIELENAQDAALDFLSSLKL